MHPYMGDNIADELMQDLLGRLGDRPLFPRLQVLQTLDVYPSGLDKKSALLYSGLRVLSLSMSHDITQRTSEVVPRVLETVYTTAPNLTTLILAAEEDQNIEAGLDTLAIIISFRGLRQLHFDGTFYLNYACLAQLANLERLEHLSASLHLRDVPPSKAVCFPLVHDATLRGSSADLAAFFVHFAIPNLKTLTANATTHDLRVSLRSAITDLFDHVPRTLTTLCLEQDWMRVVDTSRLGVRTSTLLDILQPLLQFRLLHAVEIAFAYLPPIDDDGIKSMLEAWPDLTHLTIAPGPSFTIEGDRIPTTKSLVLAATKYPKLKELHLPLVDISDTAAMLVQNESFSGHPLKAISLRPKCEKSEHHRIFQLALLIDRLFPHLEFPLESASDYCRIWNALSKHLMCMSAGRKHARLMELFETGRVVSVCMCGTEPGIDKVPHVRLLSKLLVLSLTMYIILDSRIRQDGLDNHARELTVPSGQHKVDTTVLNARIRVYPLIRFSLTPYRSR